jgi:hypothetical protein
MIKDRVRSGHGAPVRCNHAGAQYLQARRNLLTKSGPQSEGKNPPVGRRAAEHFHDPGVGVRKGASRHCAGSSGRVRDLIRFHLREEAMQERKSAEKKASETIHDMGENVREAAGRARESSSRAAEGFREYQLKLILAAQANTNALFEYAQEMLHAQSMSDLMEISTAHSRRQWEMIAEQTRGLAASAQKIATDTTRPLTGVFSSQGAQMS